VSPSEAVRLPRRPPCYTRPRHPLPEPPPHDPPRQLPAPPRLVRRVRARRPGRGEGDQGPRRDGPCSRAARAWTSSSSAPRDYEKGHPERSSTSTATRASPTRIRVRVARGALPGSTNAGLNYWALIRNGDILPLDESSTANWEGESHLAAELLPGQPRALVYRARSTACRWPASCSACGSTSRCSASTAGRRPPPGPSSWRSASGFKDAGIEPVAFQGQYHGYAMMLIDGAYFSQVGKQAFEAQKNLEPGSFDNPALPPFARPGGAARHAVFPAGRHGHVAHPGADRVLPQPHRHDPCGSWPEERDAGKIPDGFEMGAFNFPVVPGGVAIPPP